MKGGGLSTHHCSIIGAASQQPGAAETRGHYVCGTLPAQISGLLDGWRALASAAGSSARGRTEFQTARMQPQSAAWLSPQERSATMGGAGTPEGTAAGAAAQADDLDRSG